MRRTNKKFVSLQGVQAFGVCIFSVFGFVQGTKEWSVKSLKFE